MLNVLQEYIKSGTRNLLTNIFRDSLSGSQIVVNELEWDTKLNTISNNYKKPTHYGWLPRQQCVKVDEGTNGSWSGSILDPWPGPAGLNIGTTPQHLVRVKAPIVDTKNTVIVRT